MAMTILNNSAANMTLGELNKNINKVGKQLTKLATGQRITGASDDSASFAISEKMREQLRSLEQDIQNVQNGSSMLKTAHGGIENIVEELRSLKELAIDAANDSNTDADRQIIQKEFDQRRATIDEIATWTNYNGKPLLDGTYFSGKLTHETKLGAVETRTVVTGTRIETIHYPGSQTTEYQRITVDNTVTGIVDNFEPVEGIELPDDFQAQPVKYANRNTSYDGSVCNQVLVGASSSYSSNGSSKIAVRIDFSGMETADGNEIDFSDEESVANLNGQGFTILCGRCNQFINIKFNTESADTTYGSAAGRYGSREYEIGLANFGSSEEEFIAAIFDGISKAKGKPTSSYYASVGDTGNSVILDKSHDVRMAKDDDGNYYFLKNDDKCEFCFYDQGLYQERAIVTTIPARDVNNVVLEETEISTRQFYEVDSWSDGNPLWIHHGTKANQRINVYINDMRSEALGINEASVTTRDRAKDAIEIIDQAIEYSLNEATNMGAYLQRLEYTEANVTTQDENVQAAESTIRDADMAKEMTEYTKQNVLSQAAQSMLAQANQNMSSVLSLLQ
ncbi:MAG: flagellin [Selenomonadaceae bacterium]|nr:flagellin [Selenomonadaceae bacterium]